MSIEKQKISGKERRRRLKEGKSVRDSAIEEHYEVFPNDLNPRKTMYGGRVMYLIDSIAGIVARKHSGKICVTASVDSIDFLSPVYEGEILLIKAAVNRVWETSCEVGVKVLVEDPATGKQRHVASAYLTFVSLDENLRPVSMSKISPQTKEEKRRYKEAGDRRRIRLERRNKSR